ncbi:MAG TPA: GAF domain-containing protein [Candidatus Acidoferrales bacterium]
MFKTQPKPKDLIPQLDGLAAKSATAKDLMTAIVTLLHQNLLKYNWVGFYMIDPKDKNMLELGPFKGSMTPHTRIPLNQGICGAAASTGKTVVVDDVNADSRYLACSTETKSEIVVPIFVRGEVKGELDIDSHFPAAFASEDHDMCEHVAKLVGRWLETHS